MKTTEIEGRSATEAAVREWVSDHGYSIVVTTTQGSPKVTVTLFLDGAPTFVCSANSRREAFTSAFFFCFGELAPNP